MNLLDTLLGLTPQVAQAATPDPNKQLLSHLERALLQAFPQIYSSPAYTILKPMVDEFMPEDTEVYAIANGILKREGAIWEEMEKHLMAIVDAYESKVITVEHASNP